MRLAQTKTPRRGGFTLIELLIVIGIIVLLVALTTAGVMKALDRGAEVRNRNEISQLASAVTAFEGAFHVDYVPSRIRLREDLNYAPFISNSQYEADSYQYLLRLWPRLQGSNHGGKVGVDWDGDGVISANPIDLEGDQCLVFFLGGIPIQGGTPGTQGFSSDQYDPSIAAAPGSARKGPYFEFQSSRLFDRSGLGFYSYSDTYTKTPPGTPANWLGIPYAYFSSYKAQNGYLRYATTNTIPGNNGSDCSTLGVSPYASGQNSQFMNPSTFQIISAGANGQFGRGSLALPPTWPSAPPPTWSPATAGSTPATWGLANKQPSAGLDDMSNFHSLLLGIPVQQ